MSFLDRIAEANTFDLSGFRPFAVGDAQVGWVRPVFTERLAGHGDVFLVDDGGVRLSPDLADYAARTAAVDGVLRQFGLPGWRDEMYPVATAFDAEPLLGIERAAAPHFGFTAYGVQVNGYVRTADGLSLWVARRSADKETDPGKLDSLIGGGQPVGIGVMENLAKEAREEAGVAPELIATARPVGIVACCRETPAGLEPDIEFTFDLELPPDFRPRNTDGEVAEFMLWPVERVMETVRATTDFKFNINLTLIDFFIRHGLVGPDDPGYLAIVDALRRPTMP